METLLAVDQFRDRLNDVLGPYQAGRTTGGQIVKLSRRGTRWVLRAPLGRLDRRQLHFSVTSRRVTLGAEHVVLPASEFRLSITEASIDKGYLKVAIEQFHTALAGTQEALGGAEAILKEAADVINRLGGDTTRSLFVRRALRGVGRMANESSIDAIADAAAAPTDVGVFVRALEQPEFLEPLRRDDPLAPARIRGLAERASLLGADGDPWDVNTVAAHLRVTRQAINRRRQQVALLAVNAGRRGFLYPSWQFTREGTLRGLEPVLSALKDHDPWMQLAFMVTPNARLGDASPVEALLAGKDDEVLRAAAAYGVHGAA